MHVTTVCAPPLAALALSAAVLFAPAAAARPECGTVGAQPSTPQTTLCTTSGGSTQIVTGPPAMGQPTWPGFTYRYWDYPNYIVQFP
ncbi:hypothetical protein BVC93_06915 [Mycobacterium sp. MS1601]|uniref:hypothetical protein n=1 Tax=Mycobacterium sp. MS1601 TaxID=1936029 RepID=UPI0009794A53|nr:hypothetical protein [Mycobacterium sp. MS1601]AQA02205.1 hypothetical protein BVC93_06915 [Mycobacterium sp. MS1601]